MRSGAALAVEKGDYIAEFSGRGVAPALRALDEGAIEGALVADKVVGAAAAFIFVAGGASEVFALLISERALQILKSHNISCTFSHKTDRILNHKKDGFCPMESAVEGVDDPAEAVVRIRKRLAEMQK